VARPGFPFSAGLPLPGWTHEGSVVLDGRRVLASSSVHPGLPHDLGDVLHRRAMKVEVDVGGPPG